MGVQEILDRDTLMADIEEIRDVVVNKFDDLDTIVLLWETTEGIVHHRAYGESTHLVGLLAKAEYIILREEVGETEGK